MQEHEAKLSYRQRAVKLVDDEIIDCRMLMLTCLRHMSQDDIKDMLICLLYTSPSPRDA